MSEYYIGLMSGTSMDAIDAALIDCSNNKIKLVAHHSQTISKKSRFQINELCTGCDNELEKMLLLDTELGKQFANCVISLLKDNQLNAKDIIAIGSHGQTIRHYPQQPIQNSLQIVNPSIIAELTGITTIADFRRRDIAAGGQGAPLVPAFHQQAFSDDKINTVVLNIGGIANITVLPADKTMQVIGFDTGPGNGLLDAWVQTHKLRNYDDQGQWAASGTVQTELVKTFFSEPYFQQHYPKSTGRELFNITWLDNKLAECPQTISEKDIQASLVELTVQSIANDIGSLPIPIKRVLVCGGGARNNYLMSQLQIKLAAVEVSTTKALSIEPEWIEAMAFAWLAKQTKNQLTGNIASATGAKNEVILGAIYQA